MPHYNIVASTYFFLAKIERVDRLCSLFCPSRLQPLFVGAIKDGLRWANGSAHGALALAGAVIAQVTLLHVVARDVEFRHAERTGVAAIFAIDATRFVRRLYYAVLTNKDGLRRADLGTGSQRALAVHTECWRRGYSITSFDKINVDHALAFVRIAFTAG